MRIVRAVLCAALVVAVVALPVGASAQPDSKKKTPLIGMLEYATPDAGRQAWWKAFHQALRELGYIEGQSVAFEARWAKGRPERLPELAAELVRLKVDVIVTGGGESARAARQATATIPIVMATGADPVKLGVAESLGRPGGNVTGVTSLSAQLISKRIERLRELLPKVSRVAVLWDGTPNSHLSVQEVDAAARTLGIAIHQIDVGSRDFERAFSTAAKERAMVVVASPAMFGERKRIADLAIKHRLPTVVGGREYAEAGGLFSYAVHYPDLFRRAAVYVDKILKGARPGDLPIEQPTRFELVINLKTARALGVTVPKVMLLRADETIE